MNCLICRQAGVVEGFTSITFEREEFRLLIHHVPAQVCPHCGEAIVTEEVALQLLDKAEESVARGIIEDVCEF